MSCQRHVPECRYRWDEHDAPRRARRYPGARPLGFLVHRGNAHGLGAHRILCDWAFDPADGRSATNWTKLEL